MIKKSEFYKESDSITPVQKRRIWKKIRENLSPEFPAQSGLQWKSFSMGFAAAFLFLFSAIGMYTAAKFLLEETRPVDYKINSAYLEAINELESNLPRITTAGGSIEVDEFIELKREELQDLDSAIKSFESELSGNDYSHIKLAGLRNLYRQKLKVLEKIIDLEGNRL